MRKKGGERSSKTGSLAARVEAKFGDYELEPLICAATAVNAAVALVPIALTAPKQVTMINESITAYSTAVGPSSDFRKRLIF